MRFDLVIAISVEETETWKGLGHGADKLDRGACATGEELCHQAFAERGDLFGGQGGEELIEAG